MKQSEVKVTGALVQADFDKEISVVQDAVLNTVGEKTMLLMRTFTRPFDYTKHLTESISWRTKTKYHRIRREQDLISAPIRNDTVYIGSANTHAWFREYGSGPHLTKKDSALFLKSIKEWMRVKLHKDPEGADADDYWAIVTKIRKSGTEEQPFVKPTEAQLPKIALEVSQRAMSKMWDALVKKFPVKKVSI